MSPSRLFLPLLFALSLLSAQQIGAAHAISHALEQSQKQDGDSTHSPACEKCENYAQSGNALAAGAYDLALLAVKNEAAAAPAANFQTVHTLAASARGPPELL